MGLLQAEVVSGSTFKVNPIQIAFSGDAKSALLTLTNESEETLRFEVTAFAWDQSTKGDVKLQPTDEIVFFPRLFTVPPGKEQKIRVGTTGSAVDREKTYRIFVEELRPLEKPQRPLTGSQVRVLTKMGIPIFLQPPKASQGGAVADLALGKGVVSFQVRNLGNVHFSVYGVRVVGTGAPGVTVFDRKADGWYVLAGGSRAYDMTLSEQECRQVTNVAVEAQTDIGVFKGRFDVAPGSCAAPADPASTTATPRAGGR